MNKYKILCINNSRLNEANELANFTHAFELVNYIDNNYDKPYLILDETGLSIKYAKFNAININSIYQNILTRTKNLEEELLIKAIKIKNKEKQNIFVLDLTAGLGKDALLIAKYGYNIIMIEQNPFLATIIYYANWQNIFGPNATILYMDSIDYLNMKDKIPVNIIYLDPMFEHNKSSKAKKEMQIIQIVNELENYKTDNTSLFTQAILLATNKVIVKRDNKQPNIIQNHKPSYSKHGKTIRFDIYTLPDSSSNFVKMLLMY